MNSKVENSAKLDGYIHALQRGMAKFGSNSYFLILRDGFSKSIPISLIGSFALIIMYFPYADKVLSQETLGFIQSLFSPMVSATLGMLALYISASISYQYGIEKQKTAFYYLFVGVMMFLMQIPLTLDFNGSSVNNVVSMDYLGAKGIFVAIVMALLSGRLMELFEKHAPKIRMPDSVPPAVERSFSMLIPMLCTLLVGVILRFAILQAGYSSLHDVIYQFLQIPLTSLGTSAPAFFLAEFIIQLLWFFGLQGDSTVEAIIGPVWEAANLANLDAFIAGDPLPHIFNLTFHQAFVISAMSSAVIAALIVAKSQRLRAVSKAAAVPAIFNISEPVVFGFPMVLNFKLFIPWVMCRVVNTAVYYVFIVLDLVGPPTGVRVPWTTPQIISGFITTNSYMGSVVQIVQIAIGVLIWIPFIRNLDKTYCAQEKAV